MRIISVNPGSHTFRLLQLLSVVGEFPVSSLSLLGSVRTLTALIRKLESRHLIRLEDGRIIGPYRLLNISGRIPNRTIRMYSDAISVMDAILPGASAYYLDAFFGHRFPGNVQHIIRNHRVAEATACFQRAGIEFRPYVLPQLQNTEILPVVPDWPRFYPSRAIKRLTGDEFNKTMYSRMVGAVLYPGGQYTVYNTRSSVMRWKGRGEIKAAVGLDEAARWNNGAKPGVVGGYSALLFGKNQGIALETLRETAKDRVKAHHFNNVFYHIHFIPLDDDGIRLLGMLTLPDWEEMILDSLFPPQNRISGISNFDAQREGVFYVSHLDSDLSKLIRVKQSITGEQIEFICFPWQAGFIREYFGEDIRVRVVEMGWMEVMLGIQ